MVQPEDSDCPGETRALVKKMLLVTRGRQRSKEAQYEAIERAKGILKELSLDTVTKEGAEPVAGSRPLSSTLEDATVNRTLVTKT